MSKLCNEEKLAILPINIQDSIDFNQNQKLILSKLYLMNGLDKTTENDGWFFITNEELAQYANITTCSVVNITTKLKNVGFIERVSGKRNKATEYKLNLTTIDEYKDKRKGKKNTVRKINLTDKNLTETLLEEIKSLKLIINDLRNDIAELKGKGKKNDNVKNLTTDTESDKEKENKLDNIIPEYTSIYDNNISTETEIKNNTHNDTFDADSVFNNCYEYATPDSKADNKIENEMICMSVQYDTSHDTKHNDIIDDDDMNKTDEAIRLMRQQADRKENITSNTGVQVPADSKPNNKLLYRMDCLFEETYGEYNDTLQTNKTSNHTNEVSEIFDNLSGVIRQAKRTEQQCMLEHYVAKFNKQVRKANNLYTSNGMTDKQYKTIEDKIDEFNNVFKKKQKTIYPNNEYEKPQPRSPHFEENDFKAISATFSSSVGTSSTQAEKCAQNGLKCEIRASDVYAEFKRLIEDNNISRNFDLSVADGWFNKLMATTSTIEEKKEAWDGMFNCLTFKVPAYGDAKKREYQQKII